MENLTLYNKFRHVPPQAQKTIRGGRLKGMTDINPMWRLKVLTEEFGPVGKGWYFNIDQKWTESGDNGIVMAFIEISMYVKYGDEWSQPIRGTGGSTLVSKESSGLYSDDEAFKKALTDAIGGACKLLGIGADVYFEKDSSKYDIRDDKPVDKVIDHTKVLALTMLAQQKGVPIGDIERGYQKKIEQLTMTEFMKSVASLEKRPDKGVEDEKQEN